MDPVTSMAMATDLSNEVAQGQVDSFLTAVVGEKVKGFGGLEGDQIAAFRHHRLVEMVTSAQQHLAKTGLQPKQVPLKIIHPLLEEGTLETEPELQERWNNLLAYAVDPRQVDFGRVAFVSILKELTTREVRFLDALFEAIECRDVQTSLPVSSLGGYTEEQFFNVYSTAKFLRGDAQTDADVRGYNETIDLLIRNRVLSSFAHPKPIEASVRGEGLGSVLGASPFNSQTRVVYRISELGWAFLAACRAPK